MVDADFAQFVSPLVTGKAECAQIAVNLVEGLVRNIEPIEPTVVLEAPPDVGVDWPAHPASAAERRLVRSVAKKVFLAIAIALRHKVFLL